MADDSLPAAPAIGENTSPIGKLDGTPLQPSARALAALSLFATLGTLTEAAEQLGVTRSALSHRIAELEKRLGVALVRKVGRRIALTEDGERLLRAWATRSTASRRRSSRFGGTAARSG